MAKLFAAPFFTALDSDGDPISGATLEWFLSGTSTPSAVYSDNALLVAQANPVVADSAGRFPAIYLADLDYKAVLKDALGATIRTIDPVHGVEATDPADLAADNVFTKTTTWKHGDDVASAATLTLGDGNAFDITGVSTIKAIASKGKGTIVVLKFNATPQLRHHATDLVLPGGRNIKTAAGDVAIFEEYAAGDWRLVSYQRSSGASVIAPLPTGYLSGARIANSDADPANAIDVSATTTRDDSDSLNLITTEARIVSLATAGVGGLDSGAKAPDTWYHLWQIGDSSGVNQTSFILSTSVSAPTLPSGWDRKRLLEARAVLTDSTAAPNSAIIPFSHDAEEILWLDPPLEVDGVTVDMTAGRLDLVSVPLGLKVRALLNVLIVDAAQHHVYFSSPDVNDEAPAPTAAPLATVAANNDRTAAQISVRTNTASQIRARSDTSIDQYRLVTLGWAVPAGGQGAGPITGLVFNVKDFGAKGDAATEDTVAFQSAIDAAAAGVGIAPPTASAIVFAPAGNYKLGRVVLKDRVFIKGDSLQGTVFQAKSGLNDHLFIGDNFATLTGQNKNSHLDGVLTHWGFFDCRISGNKANNTAGDCIRVYGKSPFFERVFIYDAFENGLYTETGISGSANTWPSIWTGSVGPLWIHNCGNHGWHNRGPHDLHIKHLVSYLNDVDGMFIEGDGATYQGTADIDFAHIYANGRNNIRSNRGNWRASQLILENAAEEGLALLSAQDVQIANLTLYANCKTSGTFQCSIDAGSFSNVIKSFRCERMGRATVGALQIVGDHNTVEGAVTGGLDGGGDSTGTMVDVQNGATFNSLDLSIRVHRGAGATGLRTGLNAAINNNTIKARIEDCTTLWRNENFGEGNIYQITGKANSGQAVFGGAGPNSDDSEFWDVVLEDSAGAKKRSRAKIVHSSTIDLNSTAVQTFVVPHPMIATVDKEDVSLQYFYSGSNTAWKWGQTPFVSAAGGVSITVKCKLDVAAGAAETADLVVQALL